MQTTKATFNAPTPQDTAKPNRVAMTLTVTESGDSIQVNYFPSVNKQTNARSFLITAEDDETFIVPSDLHPSTVNMLVGIGQRFQQLQRYGFDREP